MKSQKSAIPYILLLFGILIGLPIADHATKNVRILEYNVTPTSIDVEEIPESNLLAQTISN